MAGFPPPENPYEAPETEPEPPIEPPLDPPEAERPWWVATPSERVGSRRGALALLGVCFAIGVGLIALGDRAGAAFLSATVWVWLAIRWVDRHRGWPKKAGEGGAGSGGQAVEVELAGSDRDGAGVGRGVALGVGDQKRKVGQPVEPPGKALGGAVEGGERVGGEQR